MTGATKEFVIRLTRDESEREKAYRLRYDVYVEELGVYGHQADHERRLLTDETDEGSDVFVALAGEAAIGTARLTHGAQRPLPDWMRDDYELDRFAGLVPEERMCLATRFMVRREYRGTTVPVEIIAALVRRAAEFDVDLLFADCEPHLLTMYAMLGFRPYCGMFVDDNGDLFVPIACLAHDREHFEAINSPLLAWVGDKMDPGGRSASPAQILERCDLNPPVQPVAEEIVATLHELGGIFDGLQVDEVAGIVKGSHVIELEPRSPLIRPGNRSRNAYAILEGTLEAGEGARSMGPGETVGEVALLTRGERSMRVVAGPQGARVLTLSERTMRGLIESHSRAAAVILYNLARTLASRLADPAGMHADG